VNVGYFRTWYGSFFATDNTLVALEDYDTFCITAPSDPQLPNPSEQVCGLPAIKPNKFGQQSNVVSNASQFGRQIDFHNAVDVTLSWRFGNGGLLTGGTSVGKR
jgi:hypothetical protein